MKGEPNISNSAGNQPTTGSTVRDVVDGGELARGDDRVDRRHVNGREELDRLR